MGFKQSPESDRRGGESSLRASEWNDVLDCRWRLQVFVGDCVSAHMWLTVGFCVSSPVCVCVRGKEPGTVTVIEMYLECSVASHILMTQSFYWTINRWRSGENTVLRHWSVTDQTSTPFIILIPTMCGCLLTALYEVVCLAPAEECGGL